MFNAKCHESYSIIRYCGVHVYEYRLHVKFNQIA